MYIMYIQLSYIFILLCQCIFLHIHMHDVLCIVCIYIYMIYIPGSTMVTACAFPNFLGSARQLRESRTPAADITWALPIILFDFHVWTLGRSIDVVSGKFSVLVEISCQQRFPQEFHSSCPVTPVPSEVGCCLSTNQYTLVTEAVFHSGQGTTPPVGSLGFTNPKAVDYRLISHSFWFFTVIYWCMSILHKARWSNYHSLSQLKCRWIISVVDLSLLKPGWQQGSHGREIKYSIKRKYYSSACLRTAQSNWTKNNEHV